MHICNDNLIYTQNNKAFKDCTSEKLENSWEKNEPFFTPVVSMVCASFSHCCIYSLVIGSDS